MKGKLLIVLLSLMLAFGMIIASCDDGTLPTTPVSTDHNKVGEENSKVGVGIKGLNTWNEGNFPARPSNN